MVIAPPEEFQMKKTTITPTIKTPVLPESVCRFLIFRISRKIVVDTTDNPDQSNFGNLNYPMVFVNSLVIEPDPGKYFSEVYATLFMGSPTIAISIYGITVDGKFEMIPADTFMGSTPTTGNPAIAPLKVGPYKAIAMYIATPLYPNSTSSDAFVALNIKEENGYGTIEIEEDISTSAITPMMQAPPSGGVLQ